jgi:hypothetical protein
MSTAGELLEAIERVNVMDIARTAIERTAAGMIELQQSQMMEGKGKTKNIGRYRNKQYAQFKSELNPTAGLGNVDLKLTGAFFAGMEAKLDGDDINIDSTDEKAAGLTSKYGGQIWGLNDKNQKQYNEDVFLPEFQAEVTKITGLKFS